MRIRNLFSVLSVVALSACATNTESKSELKQRAQAGDIEAQYRLGERYANSAFGKDAAAIYWLCRAAKDGHVPAQLNLAMLYEEDAKTGKQTASQKGQLSNLGNAYFWYTAAASQGSEAAFLSREELQVGMDADELNEVKRRATRWQQSVCVEP